MNHASKNSVAEPKLFFSALAPVFIKFQLRIRLKLITVNITFFNIDKLYVYILIIYRLRIKQSRRTKKKQVWQRTQAGSRSRFVGSSLGSWRFIPGIMEAHPGAVVAHSITAETPLWLHGASGDSPWGLILEVWRQNAPFNLFSQLIHL